MSDEIPTDEESLFTLEEVARDMAVNLARVARDKKVSLSGLTTQNFVEFLDGAFKDNGTARSNEFVEIASAYASQSGEDEGPAYDLAEAEAVKAAIEIIQREWPSLGK